MMTTLERSRFRLGPVTGGALVPGLLASSGAFLGEGDES